MPQRTTGLSAGERDRRAIRTFGAAAIAIIGITIIVRVPAARRAAGTLAGPALKAKRGEPAEVGDDVRAGTIFNPIWMFPRGPGYLIARPERTAPALTGTTITTWCQTCGNPVENRQCACWAHVAGALQRYLGIDFDGSAQMAADLWKQEADKERVWSAEYASDHDVETYPAPLCPPGLAAWAHDDCAGTFTFHERLPKATVFACATCGQQRVAQDDPEASDRAMNALAAVLIDAAFGPDQMAPAEVREQDARNYPHDEPCPRCGRRQWAGEPDEETCQACGHVCTATRPSWPANEDASPADRGPDGGLWRTTAVIWSHYCGDQVDLSVLAREAETGDAYCSVDRSEFVPDPASDPDWDGTEFFG